MSWPLFRHAVKRKDREKQYHGVMECWSVGVLEPTKTQSNDVLKVISYADFKKPNKVRKQRPVQTIYPSLQHSNIP
jgi:hypothetical protein